MGCVGVGGKLTGASYLANNGYRTGQSFAALIPCGAQDITAIGEVPFVRGEDFERNGAVVTAGLESGEAAAQVDCSGAKRQVEICMASVVVVQMDMFQARTVCAKDFFSRIMRNLKICMSDVEV